MADYQLTIPRFDPGSICATRQIAKSYLDNFDRHRYGQLIAVRYYSGAIWADGSPKVEALFAMGIQDWNQQPVGAPITGEKMYVIISDTGDKGHGQLGDDVAYWWNLPIQ